MANYNSTANLIWNIAELLRGSWKNYEYQDVILPLTVLKRIDQILENTKEDVLSTYTEFKDKGIELDPILRKRAGRQFYNISPYDFNKLLEDPNNIKRNFKSYLKGYSKNIREIIEKFNFEQKHLKRLEGGDLLFQIIQEFNKVDLHPNSVPNEGMGYAFEELIRRFSEQSNETAGEHYSPREVIEMMVDIIFSADKNKLNDKNKVITVYDCACGTGGMLTISKHYLQEKLNAKGSIYLFGQELNPVTYAICKSDILIKGEDADKIKGGEEDHTKASTLSNDAFPDNTFDYMLTNPPFGVDWKKDKQAIEKESSRGFAGRFGAGLPRISDGQMLFLQHMLSKMKKEIDGGSRIAIVFNGSPLFTGDAGSGESEIRRWILEHDWLEAIVSLPDQLFYNTGIYTYVWILTNRKEEKRKNKVQLIDARTFFEKMKKSLGNKRKQISEKERKRIHKLYEDFKESKYSKIFNYKEFGFRQIIIERPLKLNFATSKARIEKLKMNNKFIDKTPSKKKGKKGDEENKEWNNLRKNILIVLDSIKNRKWKSRKTFLKDFNAKLKSHNLLIPANMMKTVIQELSEQDEKAEICKDKKGNIESNTSLRDKENVPLNQDIYEYFKKEVKPYVPDAWINESIRDEKDKNIGKVGYEIPFTRYFYKYIPLRPLEQIEKDIEEVENELFKLLKEL